MKIFLGKKFRRKDQQAEKDKAERVTGLGRKTREEIPKWNQMTALRFQTGGRHQTSPASLRGYTRDRRRRHRLDSNNFLQITSSSTGSREMTVDRVQVEVGSPTCLRK